MFPRRGAQGCTTKIVEERRDIAVARVDLVPDGFQPTRLDIARDERSFPHPGRAAHPGDRSRSVEQREQAITSERANLRRPNEFRRNRTRARHWPPKWRAA